MRQLLSAAAVLVAGAAAAHSFLPRRFIPHHIAKQRPTGPFSYSWIEKNYTQYIDQFNFNGPTSGATYQQRYLINDTWWSGPGTGPIFLYAGNEGFIDLFAQNSGLLWDLAPEFGALLVFAEHRYYGTSLPFGAAAYDTPNLAYLSAEQALVDYVSLTASLKANLSAQESPVIVFGGSYGGMLAAWAQIRHPGAFAGAIAASAPILQFMGEVDPRLYMETITNDFAQANPASAQQINDGWAMMTNLSTTQEGRDFVQNTLRICDPLTDPYNVTSTVFNWLASAIGFMAMADYPYPADFLGPMPAWPVNVSAAFFDGGIKSPTPADVLGAEYQLANLFYNYTGQAGQCFELLDLNPPGLTQSGWDYQCCTEVVQSLGQYGPPTDMFWPAPFSFDAAVASCQYQYNGTTPRAKAGLFQYGGARALSYARNIVFSQGTLDPWSLLGPTTNYTGNPSIITVVIEQGAHHLDLRAATPGDPQSVIDARNIERAAIRSWIAEWNEKAPTAARSS